MVKFTITASNFQKFVQNYHHDMLGSPGWGDGHFMNIPPDDFFRCCDKVWGFYDDVNRYKFSNDIFVFEIRDMDQLQSTGLSNYGTISLSESQRKNAMSTKPERTNSPIDYFSNYVNTTSKLEKLSAKIDAKLKVVTSSSESCYIVEVINKQINYLDTCFHEVVMYNGSTFNGMVKVFLDDVDEHLGSNSWKRSPEINTFISQIKKTDIDQISYFPLSTDTVIGYIHDTLSNKKQVPGRVIYTFALDFFGDTKILNEEGVIQSIYDEHYMQKPQGAYLSFASKSVYLGNLAIVHYYLTQLVNFTMATIYLWEKSLSLNIYDPPKGHNFFSLYLENIRILSRYEIAQEICKNFKQILVSSTWRE